MIRYCAVATLTLIFSAAAAAQAPALAGDPAKGREKTRMCEGCHGIQGWHTAFPEVYHVPKLGGQNAAYIVQALHEYKNGDRTHPSMRAIAANLSDQDIANLAAYFSQGGPKTQAASQ
jgi:cytochrome c553